MSPHIHIEDAHAAIDAVNDELTTWINRARDAEQRENTLLHDWAEADKARQAAECAHAKLAEEFTDLAANAQWLADIIQSHLAHLPEAREALDASPGVSIARLKAEGGDEIGRKPCPECETTSHLQVEKEPDGRLQIVCSRCGNRARPGRNSGMATLHWNDKVGGE